jgi:hypothetical protein
MQTLKQNKDDVLYQVDSKTKTLLVIKRGI